MAIRQKSDGSKLSPYQRAIIASAIFNYWTVKEKAKSSGRLKSTKSPKFFTTFDGKALAGREAERIVQKIDSYSVSEHFKNCVHLAKTEPLIHSAGETVIIDVEAWRQRVIVRGAFDAIGSILYVIEHRSNIHRSELSKDFFLHTGNANGFVFKISTGLNKSFSADYKDFSEFARKLNNTFRLANRLKHAVLGALGSDEPYYEYADPRIHFDVAGQVQLTAEDILSSGFRVVNSRGEESLSPNSALPALPVVSERDRVQQIINSRAQELLAERRGSNAN